MRPKIKFLDAKNNPSNVLTFIIGHSFLVKIQRMNVFNMFKSLNKYIFL